MTSKYRWSNHKIRELNNCSKTSEVQLQYARNTMSAMFDKNDTEKEVSFPETSAESTAGLDVQYEPTKKNCQQTRRVTTLLRPPLESSRQRESKSAGSIFVKVMFDLFFSK